MRSIGWRARGGEPSLASFLFGRHVCGEFKLDWEGRGALTKKRNETVIKNNARRFTMVLGTIINTGTGTGLVLMEDRIQGFLIF